MVVTEGVYGRANREGEISRVSILCYFVLLFSDPLLISYAKLIAIDGFVFEFGGEGVLWDVSLHSFFSIPKLSTIPIQIYQSENGNRRVVRRIGHGPA